MPRFAPAMRERNKPRATRCSDTCQAHVIACAHMSPCRGQHATVPAKVLSHVGAGTMGPCADVDRRRTGRGQDRTAACAGLSDQHARRARRPTQTNSRAEPPCVKPNGNGAMLIAHPAANAQFFAGHSIYAVDRVCGCTHQPGLYPLPHTASLVREADARCLP